MVALTEVMNTSGTQVMNTSDYKAMDTSTSEKNISVTLADSCTAQIMEEACLIMSRVCQEGCIAEQLEQQAVADELLEWWKTSETKVLLPKGVSSCSDFVVQNCAEPPSHMARDYAIMLLKCLFNAFRTEEKRSGRENMIDGDDQKQVFDAVLRLDVYVLHNPKALSSLESIPPLCAALVALGLKSDSTACSRTFLGLPQHALEIMNQMLLSAGERPLEMSSYNIADLQRCESSVLTSLGWRLNLPTVPDWLKMVGARLDLFTCGQFHNMLAVLWPLYSSWAWTITHKCPTTADRAPRQVAQGLICLACAFSGAIPAAALDLDKDLRFVEPVPSMLTLPELSANAQALFLAALLAATRSSFASLQQDVTMVYNIVVNR